MRRVTSVVAPGGWLFLCGVHATAYCVINGRRVPCARVTSDDLRRVLGSFGFDGSTIRVAVTRGCGVGVGDPGHVHGLRAARA